ncbi:hypothetical protein [Rhizobium leguminosarum]|uniref:hypothetical protein n=1 Tax=Rhizobium leguminosarum TaxID=384 RepID=UPI00140FB0A7|nr:hypothetical protein [Rhizobium leguminosarum]QIO64759.1 hypothetical protein HA462_06750 [Rhizobium leguminosarum bv. trifolii]
MREIFNKYAVWVALVLFLAISCIALYGFDATYQLLPTACSAEDRGSCFREWVAATSGWFGGGLAFVTLLAIRRQIQLQQRQIDYQLGDSKPTMYAVLTADDNDQPMVKFTIENHNRRPLMLWDIADAAAPPNVTFTVRRCFVNDIEQNLPARRFEGLIEKCNIPGRVEGHPTPSGSLICSVQAKIQSDKWDSIDRHGLYVIKAICRGVLADEDPKEVAMQFELHLLLPWIPAENPTLR